MLLTLKRFLELRNVLAELMFNHKVAFKEEVYCVVQCCSAYLIVLVLHKNVKGFDIEMTLTRVYLLENSKTFGRLSKPLPCKILNENVLHRIDC